MKKETWSWTSPRLATLPTQPPGRLSRWGHYGTPVLLFPSAGGDYEEIERFQLLQALSGFVDEGRAKVFSVDGHAARAWLTGASDPEGCAERQRTIQGFLHEEVLPLIRRDCYSETIEIVTAGASLGAMSAVSALCAHPESVRAAVALSGIFDGSRYVNAERAPAIESVSLLHVLSHMPEGTQLASMRCRFVHIASGEGDFEEPTESRQLASALATRHVPHRLDLWGHRYPHSWSAWREMLPRYVAAIV